MSTKNKKDEEKVEEEKEEADEGQDAVDPTNKSKGMWFNTKKRIASKLLNQSAKESEEAGVEDAAAVEVEQEADEIVTPETFENKSVEKLYTIKFNSVILPYSKFPLTQNKYIQQFFKKYSKDRDGVDKLIGVHFQDNKNSNAEGSVGIEIELDRSSSNMNIVESKTFKRFKVVGFNETTNF